MRRISSTPGARPDRRREPAESDAREFDPEITPATFHPGQHVGRYELLVPIARGGMAAVWLARLQGTCGFEKRVALKTILPHLADEPDFVTMFLDEARIAGKIVHPNVAQVLDLGEQDGFLYLVFEWVDGEPLSALRQRAQANGTPIPLPLALRIVNDVCAGLHAAHELQDDNGRSLQVVHRDVSPQNIVISDTGAVKVIDFGIAKALDRMMESTATGKMKGKIHYAAPEQARGGHIDRRADLWAVGVVLYQLLSGRVPYHAKSPIAVLDMLLSGTVPPPLPAHVPADVVAVIMKALQYSPNDRFQTAADMQAALGMAARGVGPPVTDADLARFVRLHRREQSANLALETPRPIASGRPERAEPTTKSDKRTAAFELRHTPRPSVPSQPTNSAPPVAAPRSRIGRPVGFVTVFALLGFASFIVTSKLGNSEAPSTFSVPPWPISLPHSAVPASASAPATTGSTGATAPATAASVNPASSADSLSSAEPLASAALASATPPVSSAQPALPLWAAVVRQGEELLAQGKLSDARWFYDRAFVQMKHPALLNMREHARIASTSQGPCSVLALGRPRPFQLDSPAHAPAIMPLQKGALLAWTSMGRTDSTAQVLALDSNLHTSSMPTDVATGAHNRQSSLLLLNPSVPMVLYAGAAEANRSLALQPLYASGQVAPPSVRLVSSPELGPQPSAALDPQGNLWVTYHNRPSKGDSGVWLRRLTREGFSKPVHLTSLGSPIDDSTPVVPRLAFAEDKAKLFFVRPPPRAGQIAILHLGSLQSLDGRVHNDQLPLAGPPAVLESHARVYNPSMACDTSTCFVGWRNWPRGLEVAALDAASNDILWRKAFSPTGSDVTVATRTGADNALMVWFEQGTVRAAPLSRDGIGGTSVLAQAFQEHYPPSLVADIPSSTWMIAWTCSEGGRSEAYVARLRCQNK